MATETEHRVVEILQFDFNYTVSSGGVVALLTLEFFFSLQIKRNSGVA